ncbi:stAR-related lipid transfer protein 5-like [Octopus sinensis]|uniref:StAR-related lipid transfer protein 5-like n=1 Tax=Octopus sinensis TaxID=2607531 RepID=A0A6P7SJJ0_9MOLL|nr:stAR-related lipid transfer protein 5-like [Octopus sinensis]XP_036359391.1 stAR-related lipid transfer protein 5-like [Octopus sinensis]XP_036359392.1 stAR-related lipid transfer protein 5-like [Octopus sinensis]
MSKEDYENLAKKLLSTVEDYMEDGNGWKVIVDKPNVIVSSRKSTEFNGNLYKAEGIIEASPDTVFQYLDPSPDSLRLQWDKRMAGIECLEVLSPNLKIARMYTGAEVINIISPRDFVDLIFNVENDKFIATCAVSIEYSKCPPVADFVRGFDHPCALVCIKVPGDANKTNLLSLLQPDLRGRLPTEIVDSAMPNSLAGFYDGLRDTILKKAP